MYLPNQTDEYFLDQTNQWHYDRETRIFNMSTADESTITTTAEMWDAVSDFPPSAKLIVKVLEYDDNTTLTQSELTNKSRLSLRTVQSSLQKLEESDVVMSKSSIMDARQNLYSLKIQP